MTNYYYADSNNQTVGPVSREDLDGLAASGTLVATTYVIEVGGQEWSTYSELKTKSLPEQVSEHSPKIEKEELGVPISHKAVSISKKDVIKKSEFDKFALVTFPPCSENKKYVVVNLRIALPSACLDDTKPQLSEGFRILEMDESLLDSSPFVTTLYIVIAYRQTIHWNTAHAEGGIELELNYIDSNRVGDDAWEEHFVVTIPKSLFLSKLETGLKIRVSRTNVGAEEILTIPSANIKAMFYFLQPSFFKISDVVDTIEQSDNPGFVEKMIRKFLS